MRHTALTGEMVLKQAAVGLTPRGRSSPKRLYLQRDYLQGGSVSGELAFQARDGLTYILRRVTPADVGLLNVFLYRLSDRARCMRFTTGRPCSPEFVREQVGRMLAGAAGDSITLIATDPRGGPGAVVGVAELVCDRAHSAGEVGVVVMDDVQRKGIGRVLVQQLLQIAQVLGLAELHGDMYAENRAIQRLVQALGQPFSTAIHAGEMHVVVGVPE